MNIIVVAKESKYEYEKRKFGLTHEQLIEKYKKEHANLKAILTSHDVQLESRKKISVLFPSARLLMMMELHNALSADLVISLGGDNSFTYTSHFVQNTPIVGINSDPSRSTGALCGWNDIKTFTDAWKKRKYKQEGWSRLQATIDGKQVIPATCEYFLGEKMRKDMSRYVLVYRGKEYEQKSSGILFVVGAGSTGWYDAAGRYHFTTGHHFVKTDKKAAFLVTEPFRYEKENDLYAGELLPGEEVLVYSLNDGQGYATADCWEEYDFSRGKKASITLSNAPLCVLVPDVQTH